MSVRVRFAEPSEWELVRDLRLRALAESPDAFGSTLAVEREADDYAMWVEPAWRRHGLGARLVREVLGWAVTSGARSVILGVTEANDGAAGFYEHLGFDDTGERHPLREGSELTVRVLRREL